MKIYISPSDQTANEGVGNYGNEADRMQELADILVPKLESAGHTVYGGDNSKDIYERVSEGNSSNVDLYIALHSNAAGSTARGATALYYTSSTNGKKIAQLCVDKISEIDGAASGRSLISSTYYEVRATNAVATIVEVAFHTNETDVKFIINNMDEIAQAICDAVEAY